MRFLFYLYACFSEHATTSSCCLSIDLVANIDPLYETNKDMMPITEDVDSGLGRLSRNQTLPMRRKNTRGEIYEDDPNENKENAAELDEGDNLRMNTVNGIVKGKQEKRVLKKQRRASAGQKAPAAANGI